MAECRACLVKNVRMHLITDTRYREMFEKLTGKKLSIEDGRPETICYICNAHLQRFWRFIDMSEKTEKMLTNRLLFGIEMQGIEDVTVYHLTTSEVKAVSFIDNGSEPEPEVTVTVKAEVDDVDEWEQFKEEFMDSPSDEYDNYDLEPIVILRTEENDINSQDIETPEINSQDIETAEINNQDIETQEITNRLNNTEETELKNKVLDIIKRFKDLNEGNSIQNLSTKEFSIKTEENPNANEETSINEDNLIKAAEFSVKDMPKPKFVTYLHCDKCEYRCQQSKTLRKHYRHHDPKNQFVCKSCLYRFPDALKLERHKHYCTVCRVCGKKFNNLNGMRIHVRLHTGEQPYACDLCGRGFNQKTNLQTHLRVHAREKQFPCDICHKIFPFSSYLNRHMLIHSENNIDVESMHRIKNCHKLFSRKKRVMSNCTVCGKTLRKESISMHMRLHTGQQPYSCEKCIRFFNQKCNLLTHVERCHPGDPLFACKVCYKTFAMNSELRKHAATHGVTLDIKKELLEQTETTIKKFISRYQKEVAPRMEVLTEDDKKMELIFNLGLKPRVTNHVEQNSSIFVRNSSEKDPNIKVTKRKGSILDPGIKKAKRKVTETTVLQDSVDGIKIEGFSPNNPEYHNAQGNSAAKKVIKREIILRRDKHVQDDPENDSASPENVTCTDLSQELQSDSKADELSNSSKNNTDISNSLTTEDTPELNRIFVATNRNINKNSNIETQNIKEVEIKREIIFENEDVTENEVILKSVDKHNVKPKETINVTNEVSIENVVAMDKNDEETIKNEIDSFENCNVVNSDDIEYFDDSIEIVEVEISDCEYTNSTGQNAENEEIAFDKEELEVNETNVNQNALAGTEKEKTNKEVLVTEEVKVKSQVLLSDKDDLKNKDDFGNELARSRTTSYSGVEVSVIDPDDVDDSGEENIVEEYLESSDNELIDIHDDEEVTSDEIIDLSDTDDKRDITDTKKLFPCNEPRIKLRSDLFASCHEDNLKPNLNIKDNLGFQMHNKISKLASDSNTTKDNTLSEEANANNDEDLQIISTGENNSDYYTDAEFLDSDSEYVHLETTATSENHIDTLATNKVNFDDVNIDGGDKTNDSKDGNPISAKDFEVFQQEHNTTVHKNIDSLDPPYPCEICVT